MVYNYEMIVADSTSSKNQERWYDISGVTILSGYIQQILNEEILFSLA